MRRLAPVPAAGQFWLETAAVIGGYVAAVVAGGVPGRLRVVLLVVGAGCVAVPVYLKSHRELLRERRARSAAELALQAKARVETALGDYVAPIANLLGEIVQAGDDDRAVLEGQLRQAVVDAAARLCGRERTRSVFFALRGDGGRGSTLEPVSWAGRADPPTTVFRRDADERGAAAHRLVAERGYLFVGDVGGHPPAGVGLPAGARYRSFFTVAVFAGSWNFGMLTVDALQPDALDRGDLQVARALASLLGAGLAASRSRDPDAG
ncbi:MAG TPA: hypothetical protein VG452_03640 [Egibacteraceae bacterium]|nr:hypothetical protein [Egibacteraceae bacterium]